MKMVYTMKGEEDNLASKQQKVVKLITNVYKRQEIQGTY